MYTSNIIKKESHQNNKNVYMSPYQNNYKTPKPQKKFKEIINVKNFTINAYKFKKYLMLNANISQSIEDNYQCRSQSQNNHSQLSVLNIKKNEHNIYRHNHLVKSILSFPTPKSKQHNCLISNIQTLPKRTKTNLINTPTKTLLISRISYNSDILNQNNKDLHSLLKRQILSEKRNLSCSLSKIHRNKMSEEYEVKLTSAKLQVPYLKLLHLSQKKGKFPKFHLL